jgi:hypothetical protein
MRTVEFIRVEIEKIYNTANYKRDDLEEEIRDSFKEFIKDDSYLIKKNQENFFM